MKFKECVTCDLNVKTVRLQQNLIYVKEITVIREAVKKTVYNDFLMSVVGVMNVSSEAGVTDDMSVHSPTFFYLN